ncbi:5914_t:CDS:1, partial [Entrophospora sp. SA101]
DSNSNYTKEINKETIVQCFTDFAISALANAVFLNSVLLFAPIMIREIGFDSDRVQAFSAPPFIIASIGQ